MGEDGGGIKDGVLVLDGKGVTGLEKWRVRWVIGTGRAVGGMAGVLERVGRDSSEGCGG